MRRRQSCLIVGLALGLVFLLACNEEKRAQAAFQNARQTFIHGHLDRSQKEAQRGYRRFSGISSQWAWKFKVLQAQSLLWQGDYPGVLQLLDSPDLNSCSPEATISVLCLRAVAHARQLKLLDASKELDDARRICPRAPAAACGELFQAQGVVAIGQNQFSQAKRSLEQALSLARITGDRFLETTSLLNLAAALIGEGRFDEALDSSKAAFDASESIGADDLAVAAQENLAWAYYRLGDPERALGSLIEAEKQSERLGDPLLEGNALTNMAYAHMDAHRFNAATISFHRALSLADKADNKEQSYNALRGLARASVKNGNLNEALAYAQEAVDIARQSGNTLSLLDPIFVQAMVAAGREDTSQAQQLFQDIESDPTTPLYLKWEAQHELARILENDSPPDIVDRQYRAALATLGNARESVTHDDFRISFLTNGTAIYDDYIHFLVTRGEITEALRWADYSRARTLAEGLGRLPKVAVTQPPPLETTRIATRLQSTILFYWLGERGSYLWTINSKGVQLFSLPPAAEIEHLVDRYNHALVGPQGVLESSDNDGVALYRTLITPAAKLLPPGSKVIVIPDGRLNDLNFETLLVPEPNLHYWIEDATVINASSLRLIDPSRSPDRANSRNLLLVGNAVSSGPEYSELENAPVEMQSVQRHFPASQQQVLQRQQATASAYLNGNPDKFSSIHFVAHATASRLSPLDSAIILSPDGAHNQHFKLYARDIITHPLRADLVTISSCYSAGARAYAGEGLVGLAWAFLHAGAHNVVAALWEASDVSSAQLMDQFYERLEKGQSPETALREAKLSLLHSSGPFRKPFYWGPFQLYEGS